MIKSLLVITLLSGCCSKELVLVHKPLSIPRQCIFEKFTEEEKQIMTESIGQKIYKNQESCRMRAKRINDIISSHNELHN